MNFFHAANRKAARRKRTNKMSNIQCFESYQPLMFVVIKELVCHCNVDNIIILLVLHEFWRLCFNFLNKLSITLGRGGGGGPGAGLGGGGPGAGAGLGGGGGPGVGIGLGGGGPGAGAGLGGGGLEVGGGLGAGLGGDIGGDCGCGNPKKFEPGPLAPGTKGLFGGR